MLLFLDDWLMRIIQDRQTCSINLVGSPDSSHASWNSSRFNFGNFNRTWFMETWKVVWLDVSIMAIQMLQVHGTSNSRATPNSASNSVWNQLDYLINSSDSRKALGGEWEVSREIHYKCTLHSTFKNFLTSSQWKLHEKASAKRPKPN